MISLANLPLPSSYFADRVAELDALREFWGIRQPSTLAVVGFGGIGKTALVTQFLQQIIHGDLERPDAVFGWSFDAERDVRALFRAICEAFGGQWRLVSSDVSLIQQAARHLAGTSRALLVLDGLEVLQDSPTTDNLGALNRQLLDRFLQVISTQPSGPHVLVTSRTRPGIQGIQVIELRGLPMVHGESLLRHWGVTGTPEEFQQALSESGGHPLTLNLLGSYVAAHAGGVLARAPTLRSEHIPHALPAERSLKVVLESVDAQLSDQERALLARISLFRTGVSRRDLEAIFLQSDDPGVSGPLAGLRAWEMAAIVRRLEALGLLATSDGLCKVHPIVREYFVQAIPDRGPVHNRLADHFSRLLVTADQPIAQDAADIVLEVVYHLTESRHLQPEDIKKLAAGLSREQTPTIRAYSSLLEAALQIEPRPATVEESTTKPRRRAFLSYVRDDSSDVARLREALEKHGIDVWQDTDRLMPGRRWKREIRQAIKSGDFFLACFSKNYTARDRSYMNEELLIAIEEMRLRPADKSWFIPVMLTSGQIPDLPIGPGETLRDLQWAELHTDWERGLRLLGKALA